MRETELFVVLGKGGVGKSVVSGAIGLSLAGRGKRVLLIEVGGEESLARFFGLERGTYQPQEISSNLWISTITPLEALREYGLQKLRFRFLYNLVFENPTIGRFIQALPGMSELLMMGKIIFERDRRTQRGPYWDAVVLDSPATGHGLGMLEIPRLVINTMRAGPMVEDARNMLNKLENSVYTKFVVVTIPNELVIQETAQLVEALKDLLQRRPDLVVANMVIPVDLNNFEEDVLKRMIRVALRRNERDLEKILRKVELLSKFRTYQEHALQKLESILRSKVMAVPMATVDGKALLEFMGGHVSGWLS